MPGPGSWTAPAVVRHKSDPQTDSAWDRLGDLDARLLAPWRELASCAQVDPELWFPERDSNNHFPHQAKKVCGRCPVVDECLDDALANGETHGIWGGLSDRERRALRQVEQAS